MTRNRPYVALAMALTLLVAACGGGSSASKPSSTPADTDSVEAAPASHPTNPALDYGTIVTITGAALVPQWLIAPLDTDIAWVNQSGVPATVHFDNYSDPSGPIDSGSIAPGATWTWHSSGTASIAYHLSGATPLQGNVQILAPQDF